MAITGGFVQSERPGRNCAQEPVCGKRGIYLENQERDPGESGLRMAEPTCGCTLRKALLRLGQVRNRPGLRLQLIYSNG